MELIYISSKEDRTTLWYLRKKPGPGKAPWDGSLYQPVPSILSYHSTLEDRQTDTDTQSPLAFNTTSSEPRLRSRQTVPDLFTDNRTVDHICNRVERHRLKVNHAARPEAASRPRSEAARGCRARPRSPLPPRSPCSRSLRSWGPARALRSSHWQKTRRRTRRRRLSTWSPAAPGGPRPPTRPRAALQPRAAPRRRRALRGAGPTGATAESRLRLLSAFRRRAPPTTLPVPVWSRNWEEGGEAWGTGRGKFCDWEREREARVGVARKRARAELRARGTSFARLLWRGRRGRVVPRYLARWRHESARTERARKPTEGRSVGPARARGKDKRCNLLLVFRAVSCRPPPLFWAVCRQAGWLFVSRSFGAS